MRKKCFVIFERQVSKNGKFFKKAKIKNKSQYFFFQIFKNLFNFLISHFNKFSFQIIYWYLIELDKTRALNMSQLVLNNGIYFQYFSEWHNIVLNILLLFYNFQKYIIKIKYSNLTI